jgi:hypothetical protein
MMIQICEICGKQTFKKESWPGYYDEEDGEYVEPEYVDACECGAIYSFNEGWMLSDSWAVEEIKKLRQELVKLRDETSGN